MSDTLTPATTAAPAATIMIRPWIDPLVDDGGHDPRSRYVEQFWLGVLGPTATWLLRRLVAGFDRHPDGYELDLEATAGAMGLSHRPGRSAPFTRALQRCTMFGTAHQTSDGLAVRRRLPTVAHRHLRRMPAELQQLHQAWCSAEVAVDEVTRAHRIAVTMLEVGDDVSSLEHQLIAVGVGEHAAAQVADNLYRLQ